MSGHSGQTATTENLQKAFLCHELPGLSAAERSLSGSETLFALGWSDRALAEELTAQHRMSTGSVGKTFTAATAIALVQQGLIDLDKPIGHWLDGEEWFSSLPHSQRITLRMLLSHTSGVRDHRQSPAFAAALKKELLEEPVNHDLYFKPSDLIEFVLDQSPKFPPGNGVAYSETAFIIAGLVIEKASKKPYYELVNELFLARFSLDQTRPAINREIKNMAQGYSAANDLGLPERTLVNGRLSFNPATEWTGGGFASTPRDLARWAALLFSGAALAKPYLDDLLNFKPMGDDPAVSYGLGCYRWITPFGPALGHTGEAPGYRSVMAWFPLHEKALAIQINSSIPPHEILLDLLTAFAGDCL